ncbi:MAG: pilus assembly protein [Pseudomonadales bacterium]|nr:pilus assembly protein [Pseudomonadales bacterium]
MNTRKQDGTTTAEFAVVGLVFFVVLFGVIETGRLMFVYNMLEEATRRGARMAAVCQINDAAIQQVAVFNQSGDAGASPLVGSLTPAQVQINYLDLQGNFIGDPTGNFGQIQFVQATVVGYQHQIIIPTRFTTITVPTFRTTIPRESLGVSREGFTPC